MKVVKVHDPLALLYSYQELKALITASTSGYTDIVKLILEHSPVENSILDEGNIYCFTPLFTDCANKISYLRDWTQKQRDRGIIECRKNQGPRKQTKEKEAYIERALYN
jgi:hypothetical protein